MTETVTRPTPGWYLDPENSSHRRYWNGEIWGAPSEDDRRLALASRVAHWVALGYRVEMQTDLQAVLVYGHRPNHVLHLILTILTLGLWAIVWIIVAIGGGEKRKTIAISADGYPVES